LVTQYWPALLQTSKLKEQWREGERPQMLKSTNWGPSSYWACFILMEVMRLPEKGVKMLLENATKKKPLEYPSHHGWGF